MFELIAKISLLLVEAFTFWLVLRYNVHMFQQNGYKNGEHYKWLSRNFHRQRWIWVCLGVSLAIGTVAIISGIKSGAMGEMTYISANNHLGDSVLGIVAGVIFIICDFILLIPIIGFNFLRINKQKKKLVFTGRVKRLITTNIVVYSAIVIVLLIFIGLNTATFVFAFLIYAEPWMIIVSNVINRPIEKHINNSYIEDAKKKLADNKGLIIIGITGSYGKTSLKFYLQTLLSAKYNVLATPESYNTPMGVVRTIREYLKPTHEIFLCEMGARHVGDIEEICDIVHPQHGVITSVGPQHLETFFNIDNVRKTKFELAEALPKSGLLFLNVDSEEIRKDFRPFNKIVYGCNEKTGYYPENVKLSSLGTDFTLVTPDGQRQDFHTQLIGEVNLLNVVGAIAVANSFGVDLETLVSAVRRIQPVPHRLQMIPRGDVTIIDDAFNSNPVGSKAAVETLKLFEGLRILITPGMVELGDREHELHFAYGTYAAACCDYIILVNKERTGAIAEGIMSCNFPRERLKQFESLNDALAFAYGIKTSEHKYILLENDLPDVY